MESTSDLKANLIGRVKQKLSILGNLVVWPIWLDSQKLLPGLVLAHISSFWPFFFAAEISKRKIGNWQKVPGQFPSFLLFPGPFFFNF